MIPQDAAATAAWFAWVNRAALLGDEAFALWIARQHRVFTRGLAGERSRRLAESFDALALLGAYVFASKRRETAIGGRLSRIWTPKQGLRSAAQAVRPWIRRVAAELCAVEATNAPAWSKTQSAAGYRFSPRLTPQALDREGQLMRNCVGTYADDVEKGACLIYAVRKGGVTVATLEIQPGDRPGEAVIAQLEAPENEPAPGAIWRAARLWLKRQGPCPLMRRDGLAPRPLDAAKWAEAWAPFLAAQPQAAEAQELLGGAGERAEEIRIFRALRLLEDLAAA